MNLERSSIVPVIDRLEYDGYLERRQHVADSRSKALWLTRKGARMVTKIKTLIDRAESEIFAGFSPQERTLLIGLMQRATDNLHEMISKT
jgi:DNA-binding MarR family transcriptional regulator